VYVAAARGQDLSLCLSRSREGRTARYLRRLELLYEQNQGRRGAPLEAASSSTPHPCRCGTSLLTHSLDNRIAPHAAHSFFPWPELPGARAPVAAAAGCRLPPLPAFPGRTPANPSPSPRPSLAELRRALTGFEAEPRRPPPGDPIASPPHSFQGF
jgi:hypothetical protein